MKMQMFATLTLLLFSTSCTNYELLEDMAAVDQAYIPTVYYLKYQNLEKAKPAMKTLQRRWQQLAYTSHQVQLDEEEIYKANEVKKLMEAAARAMLDQDSYHAYCSLQDAQILWSDWRACQGMEYYLDHLYAFQLAWEVVLEHLEEPSICQLDWEQAYLDINVAQQAWVRVKYAMVEWDLFSISPEDIRNFDQYKDHVNDAMKNFVQEANWAQLENMIYEASVVTRTLNELLNVFGHFEDVA